MQPQNRDRATALAPQSLLELLPFKPTFTSYHLPHMGIVVEEYADLPQTGEIFSPPCTHHALGLRIRHDGWLIQERDGKVHADRLLSGDIGIVPAGLPKRWVWKDSREGRSIHILFSPTYLRQAAGEVFGGAGDRLELINTFREHDPFLIEAGGRLVAEFKRRSETAGEAVALHLTHHVLRRYSNLRESPLKSHKGGLSPQTMKRVNAYIRDTLDGDLSLARLSEIARLSTFHFVREFKRTIGLSPHAYVIRCRIEEARRLLRATRLPIAEVALRVGFGSQSSLTSAFRRFTGLTPAVFRRG